jgi:hypothetical protein
MHLADVLDVDTVTYVALFAFIVVLFFAWRSSVK